VSEFLRLIFWIFDTLATIEAKMTRTNDVEAGLESNSSRQTPSLTVAADPAVVSERKAGHEHNAYPEGIALISILGAVAVSFFLVFLDMAIEAALAERARHGRQVAGSRRLRAHRRGRAYVLLGAPVWREPVCMG